MENKGAKELIDYYKKLTEYIKGLEAKKSEVESSLEAEKAKINTETPEEAGIFDVDDEIKNDEFLEGAEEDA